MSFEAKLKRGLGEATVTTKQLRDTNIYKEKPHTHRCTCTNIFSCIRKMVIFTQTSPIHTSTRDIKWCTFTTRERRDANIYTAEN